MSAQEAPAPVATDLHSDVRLLTQIIRDVDSDVRAYQYDDEFSETIDADLIALELLQQAGRDIADAQKRLADILGDAMGQKYHTVMEAGTYVRSPRKESTKCMDEEGLWRFVLDTRVVDPVTGEVLPTHEVIRLAYGAESKQTGKVRLTGASTTKVEALGINSDDFFEKGDRLGWTVKRK